LVVIKIGGSALTDKKRIYTPRIEMIHRAAKQLTAVRKRFSIVLVHGAGSYGHIPVRRFRLEDGFTSPKQLKGLAVTKFKLLEWERILNEIFLKHEVPLAAFLTSDFIVTRRGRIVSAELEPLRAWMRLGCVPMMGGDIVPDISEGFSILSGDQLAAYVAIELKAARLVYGVDVDGIFDSNPKLNPKAQLLSDLTPSSASGLVAKATSRTAPDVTGGMAGKIKEAVIAARHRIPVYFVNMTKEKRLQRAALGQRVLCSRILPT
jgi:isopentenyl phosphate kinase